ncbi:amidohydrolase family protein [candidate division WOR-3 bacterium]|nr:amidohydrolase family protein [candidate division WOR-3 bacterium]
MQDEYILGNGIVTDGISLFLKDGAIHIQDKIIKEVGRTEDIKIDDIEFIDAGGRLIIPGLLNPHHHLYSSLAVGLIPKGDTDNFEKILMNLWWRLDKVLDEHSIYYSALTGIIDSIKHGVTTIFDHHASMKWVKGSLSVIEKAFTQGGIKGVLCFETSDRMGIDEVTKHIEENLGFWEKHQSSDSIKSVFGLHANFTLSDKTLKKVSKRIPEELSIHIHCGEDQLDLNYCKDMGYSGPVHRLNEFGLLKKSSILAHCIHLSGEDYSLIKKVKPIIVSNPESNANNNVGSMDLIRIKRYLLGTDGMTGDIIKTLRSHYLLRQGEVEGLKDIFFGYRYEVQREFFPQVHGFRKGKKADIAVLDYIPKTPIDLENLISHLIFGFEGGNVYITIADGKILYRDGSITFLDEEEINREAKRVSKDLWRRFYG